MDIEKRGDELYWAVLSTIRKRGGRFSMDDVCEALHVSKKTIYKQFKNKQNLAYFLYTRGFSIFDRSLEESKLHPEKGYYELLLAYGNLYIICLPGTFTRYNQISMATKRFAESEFPKRRDELLSYLSLTELREIIENPAFIFSLEASLLAALRSEECEGMVKRIADLLGAISPDRSERPR